MRFPAVFGATGSLGRCVCRVLAGAGIGCAHLGGWRSHDVLAGLVTDLRPLTVTFDGAPSPLLARTMADLGVRRVLSDADAFSEADGAVVVSSGLDGADPFGEAVARGLPAAIGNKEAVVAYGRLVLGRSRAGGAPADVRPVDSEHAAAAALLERIPSGAPVDRLIITGTGGAVREVPHGMRHDLEPARVLLHPVWRMGAKITVDSATLVNKALEIVEASILFGIPADRISVMFDPAASVHAALLHAGAWSAFSGPADMSGPVRMALGLPWQEGSKVLSGSAAASSVSALVAPGPADRRAIGLGHAVLTAGGCSPMALVIADQAAVDAFLAGRMRFGDIVPFIEATLERFREAATMDPCSAVDLARLRADLEKFCSAI